MKERNKLMTFEERLDILELVLHKFMRTTCSWDVAHDIWVGIKDSPIIRDREVKKMQALD